MTPIRFEIRRVQPEDSESIEACAQMMRDSEPWKSLGRGYEAGKFLLSQPDRESYAATLSNGQIGGFVVLVMEGAFVGYLQVLCVAPGCRRSGLGRALMSFAESHIFARHANFFLTVSDFNVAALQFYQALGYSVVGTLKDYVVAGRDEYLMRKSVGPIRSFRPPVEKAE